MSALPGRKLRLTPTVLGWVMLGVVGLGLLWVVVTGLLARAALDQVRHDLPALRRALAAGDTRTARDIVARVERRTSFAADLTSGPAWWLGSELPVVGTPLRTTREVTAQLDVVGRQVLPGVASLAATVAHLPSPHQATIDLAPLRRIAPTLDAATRTSQSVLQRVEATDPSWLPLVSDGRRRLLKDLDTIVGELRTADDTVATVVPMLGDDGPRRYFLGIMNEAESRGLGGLPGSFAVVVADHGAVRFERFGTDLDLHGVSAGVDLGAEYDARYSAARSTTDYRNSTVSPDFRNAARIWAGMWHSKTGERIDGAIALDPTALSYLLAVTGSYTGPDGTRLTAGDVVSLTQQRQYQLFGSNTKRDRLRRKEFLTDLARGVSTKLTGGAQPRALIKALEKAVRHRRLVVWAADPTLESRLLALGWAGALDAHGRTFTGFTVNNQSGGKLDYYVRRSLTYRRSDCGAGGVSRASIVLHSTAPLHGLPPYVTIRLDRAPAGARVGDEALLVTDYATPGAVFRSVSVNGTKITVAPIPENGLPSVQFSVEMPAGGTVRIEVTVAEPPGRRGPVEVLRQPLAHDLTVSARSCG